jgi:hypothetical protein
MTLHAIHGRVCARQREARVVVVEGRRGPGSFIVAERAVRREAGRDVVRVRRSVVVAQVTALAGVRRVRVPVRVALVAVHVRVRAVQREAGAGGVIEAARRPTIGRVALRAVVAEVRLRVVRFHRVVEVRLVARLTRGRRSSKAVRCGIACNRPIRVDPSAGSPCCCDRRWHSSMILHRGRARNPSGSRKPLGRGSGPWCCCSPLK